MKDEHAQFSGSIPAAYDRYLGPMLFQPYAEDLGALTGREERFGFGIGLRHRHLNARLADSSALNSETDRDRFERTDVSACGGQVP